MDASVSRETARSGVPISLPPPTQPRIIAVSNQKGGVGKTTTAVNIAAALAEGGLAVLVIDLDPQGNTSTALGINPHADNLLGIYDVLIDGVPLIQTVRACQEVPGLWCAPATIDLAGAEIELVAFDDREHLLRRAVAGLRARLIHHRRATPDYIIIDCPPSLGLLTINALTAADDILIPIQCEYYALEGLTQLMRTVSMVRAGINPDLTLGAILLTMFDARTRLAAQVADEVRNHFPGAVLRSTIPRSVRISEAPSYGQAVLTYDPTGVGARAYREAAWELARRVAGQPSGVRSSLPIPDSLLAAKEQL